MENILQVEKLSVEYPNGFILHPVDLTMRQGEIVAIAGESGSGKSTFAKALLNMLNSKASVSGQVLINNNNIFHMSEQEMKEKRSKEFAICFQNSLDLFNPLLTVREHFFEVLQKTYKKSELLAKAKELLATVQLDEKILEKYPKQLSGGMAQKILILCAVALTPKLVILDEPTSSLDINSKQQVISFIKEMSKKYNITFLIVTHDLGVAKALSEKMLILYNGKLVELGKTADILEKPRHPYTKGLINSSMDINPYRDIWGIRHVDDNDKKVAGCPFYLRCTQKLETCAQTMPQIKKHKVDTSRLIACNRGGIIKVLEGVNITKSYNKDLIIKNVNIDIESAEVVSLVGASGLGKTTLSSILAGYLQCDIGTVLFEGKPADFNKLHSVKNGVQMVFQDPNTSINPNFTVMEAIIEPLKLTASIEDDKQNAQIVRSVLNDVGLPNTDNFLKEKIKNLSGGQKQRISVARALVMEPTVLIADEPTSMLDASSKANLLRLLKSIQNTKGFSMLIITHDLPCAMKISDRIYLIEKNKKVMEITDTPSVYNYFDAHLA